MLRGEERVVMDWIVFDGSMDLPIDRWVDVPVGCWTGRVMGRWTDLLMVIDDVGYWVDGCCWIDGVGRGTRLLSTSPLVFGSLC